MREATIRTTRLVGRLLLYILDRRRKYIDKTSNNGAN